MFWGIEMDLTGFAKYAWKRMMEITCEDVGVAEPNLPAVMRALFQRWEDCMKLHDADRKKDPHSTRRFGQKLPFVHAIMLLARAKKSRAVSSAMNLFYDANARRALAREIPDYALDQHTGRGKRMGRGIEHFLLEAAKVENEGFPDPYAERVRNMKIGPNLFVDEDDDIS